MGKDIKENIIIEFIDAALIHRLSMYRSQIDLAEIDLRSI